MDTTLSRLIFLAGFGQVGVLIAGALVPWRLRWRDELRPLSVLHRQMYWVYGGYVWFSISSFAALSIVNAEELAGGGALARGFCAYVAVFWGVRVLLQAVFDAREYLTEWWLTAGYHALTILFSALTLVYGWAALQPLLSGLV
jgi:hypothetical protein